MNVLGEQSAIRSAESRGTRYDLTTSSRTFVVQNRTILQYAFECMLLPDNYALFNEFFLQYPKSERDPDKKYGAEIVHYVFWYIHTYLFRRRNSGKEMSVSSLVLC